MSLIIKELIKIGESALEKANCMDPKIDAERLLLFLLSIDKTQLFIKLPCLLDEKSCESYFKLIDTRASGMPLQYITGEQEFMGLTFKVNENVLIPRQDTETLVESVMDYMKTGIHKKKSINIMDLCCGSGAIGVSLLKHLKDEVSIKLAAVDISEKALDVAKENANLNGVSKQIKFIKSDLFQNIKTGIGKTKYDIIVSNPPYIKSHIIPTLQREVAEHEPLIALDGGEDGLEFYRKIIELAPTYLSKTGMLFMEIGHDQAKDILELAEQSEKYEDLKIVKDLAGNDRVFVGKLKKVLA